MQPAALAYLPVARPDIDYRRRGAFVSIPSGLHSTHSGLVQLIVSVMASHAG
jgi:hypothetical protein